MNNSVYTVIDTQINKSGNIYSYALCVCKSREAAFKVLNDYALAAKHIYRGENISLDNDKMELRFFSSFSEIHFIVKVSETEIR